jgi:hypothetical protein
LHRNLVWLIKLSFLKKVRLGILHERKPRDENATVVDILDWTQEMVEYVTTSNPGTS